jgi:quinol monooxygenase YgiN
MIHVIAIITTMPGKRADVLAAFKDNVPAVHAEKGCIEYQPVIDFPDGGGIQTSIGPDSFIVIEKWETIEDLQAHAKSAHMAAYAKKVADMIADRSVHVLHNA